MSKKKWERRECDVCVHYNPKCRQGVCSLYPYQGKKAVNHEEKHDTS